MGRAAAMSMTVKQAERYLLTSGERGEYLSLLVAGMDPLAAQKIMHIDEHKVRAWANEDRSFSHIRRVMVPDLQELLPKTLFNRFAQNFLRALMIDASVLKRASEEGLGKLSWQEERYLYRIRKHYEATQVSVMKALFDGKESPASIKELNLTQIVMQLNAVSSPDERKKALKDPVDGIKQLNPCSYRGMGRLDPLADSDSETLEAGVKHDG